MGSSSPSPDIMAPPERAGRLLTFRYCPGGGVYTVRCGDIPLGVLHKKEGRWGVHLDSAWYAEQIMDELTAALRFANMHGVLTNDWLGSGK